MKNKIAIGLMFFCFIWQTGLAQNVGINATGTTPSTSAILDLNTGNGFGTPNGKGLIIPNIFLTATNDVGTIGTGNINSMLVYNTNAGITGTGNAGTGYYYWNAGAGLWSNLIDNIAPGSPWMLLGNATITNPAVPVTYGTSTFGAAENWMGTTDARDIVFGTNNIERYRIMQTTGYHGIGTAAPAFFFHMKENTTGASSHTMRVENLDPGAFSSVYGKNSAPIGASTGHGVIGGTYQTSGNGLYAFNGHTLGTAIYGVGNSGTVFSSIAYWIGTVSPVPAIIGSSNQCGILGDLSNGSSTGSSYLAGDNYAAVVGSNTVSVAGATTLYHFGVEGYMGVAGATIANHRRIGAVMGTNNWTVAGNPQFASLWYNNSAGTTFSLYYTSGVGAGTAAGGRQTIGNNNGDDATGSISTRIGMGGYGGLFGAWIRGEVYGLNVKGERYGMYIDGKTFTNDVIGQISTTPNGEKVVSYAVTAENVQVNSSGTANFSQGNCFVKFNENFKKCFANSNDLIINITPYGSSQGLYISSITAEGFYVKENNNGVSSLRFAWNATGTRIGTENLTAPIELLHKDYDKNMTGVMSSESLDKAATPVWWDGKKLRFEELPAVTELSPSKIGGKQKEISREMR